MMREKFDLSERELRALEVARQKADLIAWLRGEAAARDGKMAWYVARTNWRADAVAEELRQSGIEAVCPLWRRWRRRPRSGPRYSVDIPFFGNYLFVHLLMAESAWSGVLTFDGVSGLQGCGERPVPMLQREIDSIMQLLAETGNSPARDESGITVGDHVLHPVGSFAELRGTVLEVDEDRRQAVVSTVLFGREIATRCGIDDLEKLS